jgi:hypothetical protein
MRKADWLAWFLAGLIWWAVPLTALAVEDVQFVEQDPIILIANDRWMPVLEAGSQANLSIPIKNAGGRAYNVHISIGASDSLPFETEKMSLDKYISSFTGTTIYSIPITIPGNIEPGTYPLSVNVSYENSSGGGGSESATVYIKITSNLRQPQLKLMGIQTEGDELKAGSSQVVKLNLKNDSDIPISSINLRLSGFSTDGINLDNWPDSQFVTAMEAGELHPVEFRLQAGSKMASGTYPLDLAIEFKDQHHHKYTQEQKVYLPVAGKGESDDLIPRILLEDYYLGGDYVQAGQTFPLTLVFRNTSENVTVANIKVSLASEGDVFAPVGSSSSFYFPKIALSSLVISYAVMEWINKLIKRGLDRFNNYVDSISMEVLIGSISGLLLGILTGVLSSYPLSMIRGIGVYLTLLFYGFSVYMGLKVGSQRGAWATITESMFMTL